MSFEILTINPGSTSTKIAWFIDSSQRWQETIRHDHEVIASFERTADQFHFRLETIGAAVRQHGCAFDALDAVVGRGGIIDPVPGGTYRVDDVLVERLRKGRPWDHASNLGGIIASAIAWPRNIPAYIVDPVSVDELDDIARITGFPELDKISLVHALNVKATVRKAAADLGHDWSRKNYIVAHLGGGLTICAHSKGKIVDFESGNDFGPFSPERSGGLPSGDVVRLCYSGEFNQRDLLRKMVGRGGLMGYLGTSDMREVKRRIGDGDEDANMAYRSMAFQIAKAIGAMTGALAGEVDAILFTGGVAYDSDFIALVQRRVQWIAPVLIYPGEDEMKALAEGALRVLNNEETAKNYAESVLTGGNK